jgi:hypothetical protein
MAKARVPADSADSNVVPFRQRTMTPAYAVGVTPFDPFNPAHVEAWNTLFQLGWSEAKFRDKERRERADQAGMEVVR